MCVYSVVVVAVVVADVVVLSPASVAFTSTLASVFVTVCACVFSFSFCLQILAYAKMFHSVCFLCFADYYFPFCIVVAAANIALLLLYSPCFCSPSPFLVIILFD